MEYVATSSNKWYTLRSPIRAARDFGRLGHFIFMPPDTHILQLLVLLHKPLSVIANAVYLERYVKYLLALFTR